MARGSDPSHESCLLLRLDAVCQTGLPVDRAVHRIVRLNDEVTLVASGAFGIARIGLAGAEAGAVLVGLIAGGEAALAGINLTEGRVGGVLAEALQEADALTLADVDNAERDRQLNHRASEAEALQAVEVALREDGAAFLGAGGEALAIHEVVTRAVVELVLLVHIFAFP
jgi:hypothetical protein